VAREAVQKWGGYLSYSIHLYREKLHCCGVIIKTGGGSSLLAPFSATYDLIV